MDEDHLNLGLFFDSQQPPADSLRTEFELLFGTPQGPGPLGDIDGMNLDIQDDRNSTGNEGQPGFPLNTDPSGQRHENRDPSTPTATQVPMQAPDSTFSSQPAFGEIYLLVHGYSVSELIPNLI